MDQLEKSYKGNREREMYSLLGGRLNVLLWPNFAVSEEAPTTAKYGAVKKARAAASVAMFFFFLNCSVELGKFQLSCGRRLVLGGVKLNKKRERLRGE